MNKHHLANARRQLLESWLHILQGAARNYASELDDMLDAAGDGSVTPPPMRFPKPSSDMMNLLLGGLEATLRGEPDPFGITTPAKGNRPRFDRQGEIDAVHQLMLEIKKNEGMVLPHGRRDVVSESVRSVAKRIGWSESSLRKAYDDKDIKGWATLQNRTKK